MNPTRLRAQHFRTYANLDVALPTGPVGVVGANGSGKSTLVNAIDVCLFGPESRSLEPYLAQSALPGDTMLLELELEHRGEHYRVRRTFAKSGKNGKATLDLEKRWASDTENGRGLNASTAHSEGWESLTRGTVADTQAEIERVLGLTRDTFRASAYLAQGHGADFCDAAPRDRKRILADALGLGFWDRCNELARADRRDAEKQSETLNGRVALLEERLTDADDLHAAVRSLSSRVGDAVTRERYAKEKAEQAARDHEQLAERARNAAAARVALSHSEQTLVGLKREAEESFTARKDAGGLALKVSGLRAAVDELAALEAERDALAETRRQRERDNDARATLEREATGVADERRRLLAAIAKAGELHEQLLEEADEKEAAPSATCRECGQAIADEAKARAVEAIRQDARRADTEAREHAERELALSRREETLRTELDALGPLVADAAGEARYEQVLSRGRELAGARERLAATAERLEGLKVQAALRATFPDELAEAKRAVRQHQAELEWADEPEPGAIERATAAKALAQTALEDTRVALEALRVELAQARTRLEAVEDARREHQRAAADLVTLQRDLAELELLERAFGRDGVPTFVLENSAIPALEVHADELLQAFGTDYRVELRTQRDKRDGGAAETLDVVLATPAGARAYETFSGGERTRLNLALRLALARFLAHRRDASCDLLAIDEPDGLDESGMAALVDVLRGLSADGSFERLLLVSHVPALRDAFDTTITVTKTGGRSEVLVA